jgi:hypothetical protein
MVLSQGSKASAPPEPPERPISPETDNRYGRQLPGKLVVCG